MKRCLGAREHMAWRRTTERERRHTLNVRLTYLTFSCSSFRASKNIFNVASSVNEAYVISAPQRFVGPQPWWMLTLPLRVVPFKTTSAKCVSLTPVCLTEHFLIRTPVLC